MELLSREVQSRQVIKVHSRNAISRRKTLSQSSCTAWYTMPTQALKICTDTALNTQPDLWFLRTIGLREWLSEVSYAQLVWIGYGLALWITGNTFKISQWVCKSPSRAVIWSLFLNQRPGSFRLPLGCLERRMIRWWGGTCLQSLTLHYRWSGMSGRKCCHLLVQGCKDSP